MNVIRLEVEADGDPDVLRLVVEQAADRLVEDLLAWAKITDPSVALSVLAATHD